MQVYTYSMTQWLAFFFIYCFFGWCFESVYVSVHEHRWVNRGFMTGPYIPPVSYTHLYHFNCIYKYGIGTDLRYIVGGNEDVPYQNI